MRSTDKVDALLKARAEIDEQLRQHKNALTVLFTDVVGSTGFFERNGDTAGLVMIHRHDQTAKQAIAQHHGKVVKMIGDSAMAEFPDPGSAVRAAVEIERQFFKLNATLPEDQRVQVRIGLHTGVGFHKENDIFGDVVNVASKIVRRAAAAQILISRALHEAIADDQDLHCRWLNRLTIDGRTEKEDLYEVVWTDPEAYREMQDKMSSSSPIPPRYEVLSQIGAGGMGILYKVRDLETSEIVALKVLKPEIASDPEVQENFKRELCLARKITHKNVCRIYDFSRSNGTACTSMELIEGESLSAKLCRSGALPLTEAMDIARQVCAGLQEAHAQGIVHRDLKPANVMVDRGGTVKIMDFGIARMMHRDGPMTGTIVGTPEYMAPEQAEMKPVSPATDIYALGLLLYEMVTGVPAFSGDTPVAVALKQIREYPKRPREIMPQLSGAVDAVIMKSLQKDPAKRFRSIDALNLALVKASRARRASPWEIALDHWLENAEIELRKKSHRGLAMAETFLKQQDWSSLGNLRKEPMAMLGVAGMAGALTIFLWFGAWKPRTVSAQTVEAASRASLRAAAAVGVSPSGATMPAATNSSAPMESREISLFENVRIGDAPAPSQATKSQNTPELENVSVGPESDVSPMESPKPSPSPSAKRAKSPTHAATQKQAKLQLDAKSSTQAPASTTSTQTEALNFAVGPTAAPANSGATLAQPGAASQPSASEPSVAAMQPKTDSADAKMPNLYLEVGKFKDEAPASNAVDKLNQLGFHAVLMHKNLLWMQSYHVEVGPYTSQKSVAEARQGLAAQGFKAHPVN
jgi:serine/threonine protein kinase/class 3 adenylate cyclase